MISPYLPKSPQISPEAHEEGSRAVISPYLPKSPQISPEAHEEGSRAVALCAAVSSPPHATRGPLHQVNAVAFRQSRPFRIATAGEDKMARLRRERLNSRASVGAFKRPMARGGWGGV